MLPDSYVSRPLLSQSELLLDIFDASDKKFEGISESPAWSTSDSSVKYEDTRWIESFPNNSNNEFDNHSEVDVILLDLDIRICRGLGRSERSQAFPSVALDEDEPSLDIIEFQPDRAAEEFRQDVEPTTEPIVQILATVNEHYGATLQIPAAIYTPKSAYRSTSAMQTYKSRCT